MTLRVRTWNALVAAATLLPWAVSALLTVGRGNDPVHDAGWPEGALAVANLQSRVGWWEGPPFGGGQWCFQYRGDTEAFLKALTAFAAIRAPALDLVLHDGPQQGAHLRVDGQPEADTRIDWTFTVWHPESWHRLFNDPRSVFGADHHPGFRQPVDPPRLDVYLGGGGIDWARVTVPTNLRVRDERASAAGVDLSGGGLVRADIYDLATGKPVPDARLLVDRSAATADRGKAMYETVCEVRSDATGHAEAGKVPTGDLRFWVAADGYAPRLLARERCDRPLFRPFQVELARAASVEGTAVDDAGGPLTGVTVSLATSMAIDGRGYNLLDRPQATTDETGRFTLAGLATGYTQLRARLPGHCFSDFTIHAVPAKDIVLRLNRAGRIAVAMVDVEGKAIPRLDGNPLLVEVEPKGGAKIGTWGGSAQVKDDGTFEFADVFPGEYRVWAHPNPSNEDRQYAPEQIVRVEPGGRVEVRFVLGGPPVPTVKLEFRAADEQPGPGLTEMALPGSDRKLHVDSQVLLANDAIRSARARRGEGDAWQIEIAFTEAGAARFAEITDAAVGRPLAILIDSKLVSAPVVRERIESSKAVITGAFNEAEARRIAQGLAGGQ